MSKSQAIQKNHTAIDTETIKGKPILICTPTRSLIFPKTFEEIVVFLITTKSHDAHHIWTFNLTYDATGILKFLPFENLKEIYETNETIYNDIKVFFIPGKLFSVSHNHNKATLVDAAQFFASTLDMAGKTFLDEGKHDNPIIDDFKYQDGKDEEYLLKLFFENKDLIVKYCQQDADLTKRLGELIDTSCYKTYGFRLETYSSNAKIGEKATINHCGTKDFENEEEKIIKVVAYPRTFEKSIVSNIAETSFRGGIFETWRRGSFDEVTDLDINSAYPSNMIKLPHWGNGGFIEIDDNIISEINTNNQIYKYGWIACEFDCSFIPLAIDKPEIFEQILNDVPITVEATNKKIFYPTGKRRQFITLVEYYFMQKYNFICEIIGGYVWKENKSLYQNPFAWINDIYNKKTEIKNKLGKDAKKNMNYLQCKIGMNGAYGKTVQKIGFNRLLYNPFYGSYITAMCRIQVSSFIIDNKLENKVINIATDGILINGIFDYSTSEKLGEWEVNYYDNALVLGNGMLQLTDKKGIHSKLRGITNKTNIDVRKLLTKNKDKESILFEKIRPLKLGEMIAHNKIFKYEDLNQFIKFGRELKVNADKKRNWKQLSCFNELLDKQYEGKKWTVNEVNKIELNIEV